MQIQSMFPNFHFFKKVWELHYKIKMSLLSWFEGKVNVYKLRKNKIEQIGTKMVHKRNTKSSYL